MKIRNSIREWLNSWEKDLGEYLGWYVDEPAVTDMGSTWNRWEEIWCKAQGWYVWKLKFLWNSESGKGGKLGAKTELLKIRPTTVESEMNRQIALYLFYCLFRSSYKKAKRKTEKNREMNKLCKRRFIYLLFWSIIINIILFLVYVILLVRGFSVWHWVTVETFLVAALVLVALIFVKDLDINKYQETWARHTRFQYQREQEMLRFLLEAESDSQADAEKRVDDFVKAILAIEEKNIEKFCINMEDKEKGMMEEILRATKK